MQWLALLTALGGFAWLGVLAALGYLQLPVPGGSDGAGLAGADRHDRRRRAARHRSGLLAKFIAGAAARARGAAARKRLKASVAAVAEDYVVEPVELEVSRLASFSRALQAAAR